MAVTPLIKKISNRNGTFIAFQSAINDSNLIGSQQGYRFSFSKYALIKIPQIRRATVPSENQEFPTDANFVNLDAIGDKFHTNNANYHLSENFAESFQNYCLNLEALILTSVDKTASLNANVSEEIFFKWMKETGAIRFEKGLSGDMGYVREGIDRFMEPRNVEGYDSVVKYINDISAVNVTMDGSVYTEVYIYTPTDHGASPVVLFSSGKNKFYSDKSGKRYSSVSEKIYGRDESSVHPDNLEMDAIFDSDMESQTENYIYENDEWVKKNWFDKYADGNSSTGYYYVDSIGSSEEQIIKKVAGDNTGNTVMFKRSTLDGIKIDWDVANDYSLSSIGIPDSDMSDYTINEFNVSGTGECREFDYNAILLYYDLTETKSENPKSESYLYGIYFLSSVNESDTYAEIPCIKKYKSGALESVEGNALGYKINLRTDTSYENLENISTSTASRNFSMDLFHESLSAMKKFSDTLESKLEYISNLYSELDSMRRLFIDDQNKDEILKRISDIENEFSDFKTTLSSDESIDIPLLVKTQDFIRDLYKKYSEIMSNKTPIKVEYEYNKYKINSLVTHNQMYNIQPGKFKVNLFSDGGNILKLNEFSNYYKHDLGTDESPEFQKVEVDQDYYLYIDDSENKWTLGQTFRLVFGSPVEVDGGWSIYVVTDAKGDRGEGEYGKLVCELTSDMFTTDNPTPIFDIICVDADNLEFDLVKIK